MGATLADGGVNPLTKEHVIDPIICHYALAVMATAGLYEMSGEWLYDIGLPGKSGIGGGIVAVSRGKGGLGTLAPRLDSAGNSVKGRLVANSCRRGSDWTCSCRVRKNKARVFDGCRGSASDQAASWRLDKQARGRDH
jgi:glutaminase